MKSYYRLIEDCKINPSSGINGGVFFAVYRGKISEGLDLKDENCRAVVAVGIPYPAFKDPKVVLKREYNDQNSISKKTLSGQYWYESQAFRALNQALGRCVRHKNDWGAVILLDQRLTNTRNVANLSKWVRNRIRTHASFESAMQSLGAFVQSFGRAL